MATSARRYQAQADEDGEVVPPKARKAQSLLFNQPEGDEPPAGFGRQASVNSAPQRSALKKAQSNPDVEVERDIRSPSPDPQSPTSRQARPRRSCLRKHQEFETPDANVNPEIKRAATAPSASAVLPHLVPEPPASSPEGLRSLKTELDCAIRSLQASTTKSRELLTSINKKRGFVVPDTAKTTNSNDEAMAVIVAPPSQSKPATVRMSRDMARHNSVEFIPVTLVKTHKNDMGIIADCPTGGPAPAQCGSQSDSASPESAGEVHPLKEVMTAKKGKVDTAALKKLLENLSTKDTETWLDAPLDEGMPSALFFAIGATLSDVVSILLDFGADPLKKFTGEKMYQGWIKNGASPAEAVRARKGRFVGTMLGDRLEGIDKLLTLAEAKANAAATSGKAADESGKEKELEAQKAIDEAKQALHKEVEAMSHAKDDQKMQTKSILLPCATGFIEHTQGDPSVKYDMVSELEGVFSSIQMAKHRVTGEERAIKAEMKVDEDFIWEEVSILRKFNHPNVIQLYETFEDVKYIFVVIEICSGGELFHRLGRETGLAESTTSRLMRLCASAIEYIHSVQICHRDIQPENFLLANDGPLAYGQVKLIDFTMAKEFGDGLEMKTKICNLFFVAPEVLSRSEKPYTEKIDIWSLGVVFFLMICGEQPFRGESEVVTLKKIKKGTFGFNPVELWSTVNQDAKDLISKIFVVKPEDRLSAAEVMRQPWLSPELGKRGSRNRNLVSTSQLNSLRNFSARDRLHKVVAHMQQQKVPDEGMKALAVAFRTIEKQRGCVHISQVRDKIRRIASLADHQEEIMRVLWNLGDQDGEIKFDAFVSAMVDRHNTLQKEACKAVFDVVDFQGQSSISRSSLTTAIFHADGSLRSSSAALKNGIETVFGIPLEELQKLLNDDTDYSLEDFFGIMNRNSDLEGLLRS